MIATTSVIVFATSTQILDEEIVVWISSAIMNGILLGIFIGLLTRVTYWVWYRR